MFPTPPWGRLRILNQPFQFLFSQFSRVEGQSQGDDGAHILQEDSGKILTESGDHLIQE